MASSSKKPMTDEERQKLIAKLNSEVEEHISKLEPKPYKDGWSEDNWENEMNEHPLFRQKPLEEGEDMPPLIEALQQLKFDNNENTKEELANNYKEAGNRNFKLKKYRWAISEYTEGLKQNCEDQELNCILYTNRAAAHFHLGNFRSSLKDASAAKVLKSNHLKAIVRGALCLQNLEKFKECLEWCKEGLAIDSQNKVLLELKSQAELEKRKADRNRRKNEQKERKRKLEEECLKSALKSRNIQLEISSQTEDENVRRSLLDPFEHPYAGSARLQLDENSCLIWPVMFLYPEYGESDFVKEFHENSRFLDHLEVMLGVPENRPEWDKDGNYTVENIQLYYKTIEGQLRLLDKSETLSRALYPLGKLVYHGAFEFVVIAKDSSFDLSTLEDC